jgi:MmeI, DNA-methyltransferase domain/MmeI, N-terminal domain/MmeI, helicase spacer domain/MmeI, target recognition domain
MDVPAPPKNDIETFIARWQGQEGGQERANYALFLTELCDALELPHPEPADARHERNDYVFERVVTRHRDDGDAIGRIDLYRRNSFVLEAKQSRWKGGGKEVAGQNDLFAAENEPQDRGRSGARRAWDVLMLNAKRQAEEYARALPVSHGWPPFILVCDVGHCIEVYADFTGQGKNYTQFPDRQGFRIYLEDLRKDDVRERLKAIWLEPLSLDPTRRAAKATRDIAERLAEVSKALEAKNYPPEEVAHFLMRCLFTMFAEDVKLLPENCFRDLLGDCRQHPDKFFPLLTDLWKSMNDGVFAPSIRTKVLRFNGNLFAEAKVLPLGREEIGELAEAAGKNWREVEPAIFGTLLEQALDPAERRRLGAHYTPRAYVERLVVATIIEPLREDWRDVQATAETKRAAGDKDGAADAVKDFHDELCETRVLDPACGTGNFLYVSMELMKRLEGEVLEALLDLGGQEALRGLAGHTVDPHQFLGMEINPRAAAIAELVLWIGYLQWHFRTKGGIPDEPILRKFKNIEVKNAVLTWDGYPVPQFVDGKEAYPNPKRPTWPTAEFIVGNPPFLGKGVFMRDAFGPAYVEALVVAHPNMNASADFVMYWWDISADLLALKGTALRRFGLVTTNSITQVFSRRVLEKHLKAKKPISSVMAIPDHPWTKATQDAAAVRIAMTVGEAGDRSGNLHEVIRESDLDTDEPNIILRSKQGKINADLTIGVDVTSAIPLIANEGLASMGPALGGRGFVLTKSEAAFLSSNNSVAWLKKLTTGKDITERHRDRYVIDVRQYEDEEALRRSLPKVYQHLRETVFPERSTNNDPRLRNYWWRFRRSNDIYFGAVSELKRFIATVETTKHRVFLFVGGDELLEHGVIGLGSSGAYDLGVLSSSIHICWTLANGGTLEDRPRYNKDVCFDPFPFPSPSELLKAQISTVAEELDAFRKERQREHPDLTLTQMYNVLEKLKANETLSPAEEAIKDKGLILILKELHEKLDRLVFEAYGWPETLSDEQILEKLVALNHERAAEERRGHVRWLRPDYQIPRFGKDLDRMAAKEEDAQIAADLDLPEPRARKLSFPTDAVEQTAAVFAALAAAGGPVTVTHIANDFRKTKALEDTISRVLLSLNRLGHVSTSNGKTFDIRRVA